MERHVFRAVDNPIHVLLGFSFFRVYGLRAWVQGSNPNLGFRVEGVHRWGEWL